MINEPLPSSVAIGYTAEECAPLQKHYKKLGIFESLLVIIEGAEFLPTKHDKISETELEHLNIVMELYQWFLSYVDANYVHGKDFHFFLRKMREAIPEELKKRNAVNNCKMTFYTKYDVTNSMQVEEFKNKHKNAGGGWNYSSCVKTHLKRYGVTHPLLHPPFREKHIRNSFPVKEYGKLEYQGKNELTWLLVLEQQQLIDFVTNKKIVLLHPSTIVYWQDFEMTDNVTIELNERVKVQVMKNDIVDLKSVLLYWDH